MSDKTKEKKKRRFKKKKRKKKGVLKKIILNLNIKHQSCSLDSRLSKYKLNFPSTVLLETCTKRNELSERLENS